MGAERRLTRVDDDILATVRQLFPGARLSLGRRPGDGVAFRLVPGLRRTHMLVPAAAPSAAVAALDRPTAKDTRRQVLRRRTVTTVLRRPLLARAVMPDVLRVGHASDTLLDYLEDVIGDEVVVSMALGARRANRKPVLLVHRRGGGEVGYAKVGLTPLSNALIDHEASVLRSLSTDPGPRHFRAPAVLHHGAWGTSRVLLMDSLRPANPRPSNDLPLDALVELAGRRGVSSMQLGTSQWLRAITAEAERLRDEGHPDLFAVTSRYARIFGHTVAPLGCGHGDFGPWNMAWDGHRPLIWDWERAQGLVPVGMDAVHFRCHPTLRDMGNLDRARQVLAGTGLPALGSVLARLPLDHHESDVHRAVLLGYLLSMSARFSADAVGPEGAAVADLATWYRTVLGDQLDMEVRRTWN